MPRARRGRAGVPELAGKGGIVAGGSERLVLGGCRLPLQREVGAIGCPSTQRVCATAQHQQSLCPLQSRGAPCISPAASPRSGERREAGQPPAAEAGLQLAEGRGAACDTLGHSHQNAHALAPVNPCDLLGSGRRRPWCWGGKQGSSSLLGDCHPSGNFGTSDTSCSRTCLSPLPNCLGWSPLPLHPAPGSSRARGLGHASQPGVTSPLPLQHPPAPQDWAPGRAPPFAGKQLADGTCRHLPMPGKGEAGARKSCAGSQGAAGDIHAGRSNNSRMACAAWGSLRTRILPADTGTAGPGGLITAPFVRVAGGEVKL